MKKSKSVTLMGESRERMKCGDLRMLTGSVYDPDIRKVRSRLDEDELAERGISVDWKSFFEAKKLDEGRKYSKGFEGNCPRPGYEHTNHIVTVPWGFNGTSRT